MDRRTKYRHLLWWIICLDLLTVIWLGYRYLDRKIPDELYVTESQEQQVKNVLDYPLLSFDDAITVSGDGSYLLSSRILGVIPFKDVKVIPHRQYDSACQWKHCRNLYGNRRSTGN